MPVIFYDTARYWFAFKVRYDTALFRFTGGLIPCACRRETLFPSPGGAVVRSEHGSVQYGIGSGNDEVLALDMVQYGTCLLYTSPSPRD